MLPIACTLTNPEAARRRAQLLTGVLSEAQVVEPLPSGYRWRFASTTGIVARLAAVIEAERLCCRFLRFDLRADPDLADVTLDVTGPEGTVTFLADWLSGR
jgi:hypothetical protein